jgi:hypothetical protein
MRADQVETVTHCALSKPTHLTSGSVIFGYNARPGVIRTFIGREESRGLDSKNKLLGGKSNVKRDMRIFGACGDPRRQ